MKIPVDACARRFLAISFFSLWITDSTLAGEIVFADGRREDAPGLSSNAKGEWTYEKEGRRIGVRPGEVAAVVDDAGNETIVIPLLGNEPESGETAAETAAQIESLKDPKNEAWPIVVEKLGLRPTQTKLDALLALTTDKNKEVRVRGVRGVVGLRTRESTLAAARAVLDEKDAKTRGEAAYTLFAVCEIFKRCDSSESSECVERGLADKAGPVRYVFAMLAPHDLEAAKVILRGSDGLKSSDHHVRESAAMELGKRGDPAGESVLIALLARAKMPEIDDPDLMKRLLIEEQVQICAILGKLGTKPGRAALEKAKKSPHAAVSKAAAAALEKI